MSTTPSLITLFKSYLYSSYAMLTEKLPTLEPRSWMVRPEAASTKPLLFCTWFYIQHRMDHLLYIYPPRFGWQSLWHMSTHRPPHLRRSIAAVCGTDGRKCISTLWNCELPHHKRWNDGEWWWPSLKTDRMMVSKGVTGTSVFIDLHAAEDFIGSPHVLPSCLAQNCLTSRRHVLFGGKAREGTCVFRAAEETTCKLWALQNSLDNMIEQWQFTRLNQADSGSWRLYLGPSERLPPSLLGLG